MAKQKVAGANSPVANRSAVVKARANGGGGRAGRPTSFGTSPAWTARTPPDGTNAVAYTYTFVASGSPAPIYEVTAGALPTGLTLNETTGVLDGTPSAAGTFAFTVRARNSFYPAVEAAESVTIAA